MKKKASSQSRKSPYHSIKNWLFKRGFTPIDIFVSIFLVILCYFFFFDRLGDYSLRMWDESRNGINALEMLKTKNPLVTYYRGQPDMWNTKPPLLIWTMVIFFKLFGISEFTLRLPSAISVTLITIIVYLFSSKVLKDKWAGLLASLILLTSYGFADIHIGRTGDYDALLTLWTTLAIIFSFIYTHSWKRKYLKSASIFWTLAVLTKGVAGVLMLPGFFIYLIFSKKIKILFKKPEFYKSLFAFAAVVGAYYFGRELFNNGYIKSALFEDVITRVSDNNESATSKFVYYWKWAREMRFQHWTVLVPFTFLSFFIIKSKTKKNWIILGFILTISYYTIISLTQTKYLWYDAQLYPLVSLLIAMFILSLIRKIPFPFWLIPTAILAFYLQRYLRTNLAYIQRPDTETNNSCYKYGNLLRSKQLDISEVVGIYEDEGHCMPFTFYMEKDDIPIKTVNNLSIGDKAFSCDQTTNDSIMRNYLVNEVYRSENDCIIFEVVDLKIGSE